MLTDSQNFSLLESVWNLLQNPYDITHLTSGTLLHYLWKLKIQIFCKYLADMEENVNKLQFKCTDINSCTRVTVYAECIYVLTEYLKNLSIRRRGYFFGKMWVAVERAGRLHRVLEVTSLCYSAGS